MLCSTQKTNPTFREQKLKYTLRKTLIYQGLTKGLTYADLIAITIILTK